MPVLSLISATEPKTSIRGKAGLSDFQTGIGVPQKRLREIDRRIRFLTRRLEIAEVVDPALQPNRDQVFFGARVLYSDSAGEEFNVTIVGVDEAEPLQGKISWISPVARALIKAREGDTVVLRTPGGVEELDILEVHYPEP